MRKQLDLRLYLKEACFFGVIWQLLAIAFLYGSNTAIFNPLLAEYFAENLIAREALLIAVFSIVLYMLSRSFFAILFFPWPRLGFAITAIFYSFMASIYSYSWMQFYIFEKFINIRSIEMFVASPWQIFKHSEDVAHLSVLTIALVPLAILVLIIALKYFLLRKMSSGVVFGIFLAANIALIPFNFLRIDIEQYRKIYIAIDGSALSAADHMRDLTINASAPLITFKESLLSQYSSSWQSDNGNLFYSNIFPLQQTAGLLKGETIKNWDVIFIVVESLHPLVFGGHLEKFEGQEVMPAVQKIAAESLSFTSAYGQSSHSSYADLVPLSSQYPLRTKSIYIYPKTFVYPRVLIYDVLSQFGFATAIISSQNEEWQGMSNYLQTPYLDTFIHAANYQDKLKELGLKVNGLTSYDADTNYVSSFAGKLADKSTVSIITAWLDDLDRDEHYFLYTNLQNSHIPFYTDPDSELKFFSSKEEQLQSRERYSAAENMRLYQESLRGIDDQIQRIVDRLKALGRWDKTLMVITADTSILFSPSVIGNGGDIMEEVLHVPLIMKVPGVSPRQDARLMQHLDIAPTVLGYMGLNKHPGFQGKDFSSADTCNAYSFAVSQTAISDQYAISSDIGVRLIYDVPTRLLSLEKLKENVDMEKLQAEGKIDSLFEVLESWVSGQLAYYDNDVLMAEKYPPLFEFSDRCDQSRP